MAEVDQAELVAVLARGPEGAAAIVRAWDRGEAVAPLDPGAPEPVLRGRLEHLRPTRIDDGSGPIRRGGGIPVRASVGAVVSTSGTTGAPRAVQLDHAALAASARAVHGAIGAEAEDGWLCCLPLHAVAGLAILARARTLGLPLTVHERFDPDAVAAAPTTGGDHATLVSLVPTMLARLLEREAPVREFRTILLGGGPVPAPLVTRALAAGAHVATTYGMTETGGGCVHDGHPLDGVEVRLAPHPGSRSAGLDATGEILVRGPVVMRGYHRDPGATGRVFADGGWLRTGDLGAFGDDGRLRVVDRVRDLVITGGVNVSPTAVERVLAEHPTIREVCVTGAPDDEWGERVVAFVVPAPDAAPPSLESLRAFARERLTAAELPREVRVVAEIPRTPGGKPRRVALRGDD